MELAIKIFQFILSISILVILHELGHFLPAKWFKTKVEKFYLFFDPWFSVVKKKIGETEYGIGWLPFGGYVKIAGMVDESMDTEQLKKPAQPWEFRAKPAWQRLIIMLGGVTVNFFLAWIIFSCLMANNGENIFEAEKMTTPLSYSDAAKKMGFEDGDKILKVDGKTQKDFKKLALDVLLSDEVTVERKGKEVTFHTNDDGKALAFNDPEPRSFLTPRLLPVIDTIAFKEAKDAGLKVGDQITEINGKTIHFFDEVRPIATQFAGKTIDLKVLRDHNVVDLKVPVSKEGAIGINAMKQIEKYNKHIDYGFAGAVQRGFTLTIESLTYQIKQFKLVFNKKVQGYKKVGGPLAIINKMEVKKSENGSLSIDWSWFWGFTAMFSVWLAFLNLIPIPGLDGGHVIFTLYEMIVGKPVPQKVLENAQMVGVIFLLGLMVLIFGSDIFKWISGTL
ncbi:MULTISPECIES: RIP metalloprotease RseP [Chryseobacterium]|uniref:Zinc metalloprotease n=1 Tax=Chryseobacterium oryzae TaxID=2929799 RepID=A0ABY4BGT0_9FLAO|nr:MULTISPECIES: RIP metalloprotease RseP [Chryseobacterium]UOE38367.1 RIP metalloprotease RseP [Chryseobacterium oryzae]